MTRPNVVGHGSESERANLTGKEQAAFQDCADRLAEHTDEQFARLVAGRGWRRIEDEQLDEDIPE